MASHRAAVPPSGYSSLSSAHPSSASHGLSATGQSGATAQRGQQFQRPYASTPMSDTDSFGSSTHKMLPGGSYGQGRPSVQQNNQARGLAGWNSMDPELDDDLHTPDPPGKRVHHGVMDIRGFFNLIIMGLIILGLLMLFAGYPILTAERSHSKNLGYYGLGGTNGTGQVASLPVRSLIDPDTPANAKTFTSQTTNKQMDLVFSDEFEEEGRTFWPGDDPFWEAQDFFYAATNDYEWYSPEAINTTGGALQITMTQTVTHNLNFQSGMLQSWNKFCFQGGYIEMTAKLPGRQDTRGFWPGLWTMGNLGRPGFLGSTDGTWPYSYSACDWGTLPNQTSPDGTEPYEALHAKGPYSWQYDNKLSFLPGQRASACTCPGQDHPGPDVTVGRSAPEVDIIEAQNTGGVGYASQSLQTAPYDPSYNWSFGAAEHFNGASQNSYTGSVYQEAISGTQRIPEAGYIDAEDSRWVTYGFEYQPDFDMDGNGYITWYVDGKKSWTAPSAVAPAVPEINISRRLIPVEPMSIVINLGLSSGFQPVHFDELTFPGKLLVDNVRVYQLPHQQLTSCDPPDHPTAKYINEHPDLYYNVNNSIFPRHLYPWPKNRLIDEC